MSHLVEVFRPEIRPTSSPASQVIPPPASPTSAPAPVPLPDPARVIFSGAWDWLRGIDIRTIAVVLMSGYIVWHALGSPLPPLPDWMVPATPDIKAGQALRSQLPTTLADGFDAMAQDITSGKSIADADVHLKQVFHDGRMAAFKATVYPVLSAVVPEDGEVTDVTRAPYAQKCQAIAIGLRGKNR